MSPSRRQLLDRGLDRRQALPVFGIFLMSLAVCVGCVIWALNALTYEGASNDRDAFIAYIVAALSMAGVALFLAWNVAKMAHQAHRILVTPDEFQVELLLSSRLRIPASASFRSYSVSCLTVSPQFGVVPGWLVTSEKGWFCISSKFDDYEFLAKRLTS